MNKYKLSQIKTNCKLCPTPIFRLHIVTFIRVKWSFTWARAIILLKLSNITIASTDKLKVYTTRLITRAQQ